MKFSFFIGQSTVAFILITAPYAGAEAKVMGI